MSVREQIINILNSIDQKCAAIADIYDAMDMTKIKSKTPKNSIRRTLYTNTDTFKRVCKGVYMLVGQKSTSLLIEGDGRKLAEIEDESIDCIITDHPWDDKKSLKGGNRNMATYDLFRYEQSDFDTKARVLKPGSFMAEILPVESATNIDYLYEIKQMAKKAGLNFYTSLIWKSAPANSVNTGRVTKGVQQVVIFSKGKPRKLSPDNVQGYQTKEMLHYELEYHVARQVKNRNHQAEKPIELYEYLISVLTEENEVCLDQFAGSCNMLQAAINTNRFGICYEICHEFVEKAAARFNAIKIAADDIATTNVPITIAV